MNIVLGYSERPEGRAALTVAVSEARLRKATLHVAQTVQELPGDNPSKVAAWIARNAETESRGSAIVNELREQDVDAHYRLLDAYSETVSQQLLQFANEVQAGLMVIGIRRRSPVGKLVLGSIAQDILLGAACPVLAVKASND